MSDASKALTKILDFLNLRTEIDIQCRPEEINLRTGSLVLDLLNYPNVCLKVSIIGKGTPVSFCVLMRPALPSSINFIEVV